MDKPRRKQLLNPSSPSTGSSTRPRICRDTPSSNPRRRGAQSDLITSHLQASGPSEATFHRTSRVAVKASAHETTRARTDPRLQRRTQPGWGQRSPPAPANGLVAVTCGPVQPVQVDVNTGPRGIRPVPPPSPVQLLDAHTNLDQQWFRKLFGTRRSVSMATGRNHRQVNPGVTAAHSHPSDESRLIYYRDRLETLETVHSLHICAINAEKPLMAKLLETRQRAKRGASR